MMCYGKGDNVDEGGVNERKKMSCYVNHKRKSRKGEIISNILSLSFSMDILFNRESHFYGPCGMLLLEGDRKNSMRTNIE